MISLWYLVNEEINSSNSFIHCHSQLPFYSELGHESASISSAKEQGVNTVSLSGHRRSLGNTQHRCGGVREARDRAEIQRHRWAPVEIYLQNPMAGSIWATGSSLLAFMTEYGGYISFGVGPSGWGGVLHGPGKEPSLNSGIRQTWPSGSILCAQCTRQVLWAECLCPPPRPTSNSYVEA